MISSRLMRHFQILYYVIRFMEGLKPAVRVQVGIQQPADLDSAYQLALLLEELGEDSGRSSRFVPTYQPRNSAPNSVFVPFSVKRSVAEMKLTDTVRQVQPEDKWATLRAYRKAIKEGYKFVALARTTQAQWYVDRVKAEVAVEAAASSCKVTLPAD